MDKLTRKEMKSDKFALEVQHSVEYVSEHRRQMIRWGTPALAVVLIAAGVSMYRSHMRDVRQEALHAAMLLQNAVVGQQPTNDLIASFPTAEARNKAVTKAWTDLATKYSGTDEATMAEFFLGTNAADNGNLAEAEKHFKIATDGGSAPYASVAKLALAQVYGAEGKVAEGQKLLQSVIDHPTVLVSKEEAALALADLLSASHPQEARKLLEPLRASTRSAVSKVAITADGQLSRK